ncbi:hypothetical protein AGLY_010453, partial [Aphis glycines]
VLRYDCTNTSTLKVLVDLITKKLFVKIDLDFRCFRKVIPYRDSNMLRLSNRFKFNDNCIYDTNKTILYGDVGKWVPFCCTLGGGVDLGLGITYEELCIKFSSILIGPKKFYRHFKKKFSEKLKKFQFITSRNNAPISNYGGGFRCKSEYPWCIIEFSKKSRKTKKKMTEKRQFLRKTSFRPNRFFLWLPLKFSIFLRNFFKVSIKNFWMTKKLTHEKLCIKFSTQKKPYFENLIVYR